MIDGPERKLLKEQYDSFCKLKFPVLGYSVENFPEWEGVLCGYIAGVITDHDALTITEAPCIIPAKIFVLAEETAKNNHGTPDSVYLTMYVEKLRELQSQMLKCMT